jgi:hypothetical protein
MDERNEPLVDESEESTDEELKEQATEDVSGGWAHQ